MRHAADVMDQVRCLRHRALVAVGSSPLTQTEYVLLRNPETFSATA